MTPCPSCSETQARLHRCLRVLQAARSWYERRNATTMAELLDAIRDGVAKLDSRPVEVRRAEAVEMAARWARRVEELRVAVGRETP